MVCVIAFLLSHYDGVCGSLEGSQLSPDQLGLSKMQDPRILYWVLYCDEMQNAGVIEQAHECSLCNLTAAVQPRPSLDAGAEMHEGSSAS